MSYEPMKRAVYSKFENLLAFCFTKFLDNMFAFLHQSVNQEILGYELWPAVQRTPAMVSIYEVPR